MTIEGVAPGLLMHKYPETGIADLSNVKGSTKAIPDGEAEAELGAYRLETGELYQPAEHIYQALCRAAGEFQIKGRGKKTYRDSFKGNIVIEPEYIPHGREDFEVDARPARIGRARIIRHRPYLREWTLRFDISLLDEGSIPKEVVNAVLVKAGQTVGLGDYRPRFGRFLVKRFEET